MEDSLKVPTDLGFTAQDIRAAVQRRDVIIVIDVLRCCSTIVTALANDAEEIIPKRTVREARMLHKKHPELILAGERGGIKPQGFDCGNSPLEFTCQKVKGKSVVMTTTSGTKAIVLSKNAEYVFTGAFLNAEAIARTTLKIAEHKETGISFITAWTDSCFSLEDFICAGAIARCLPTEIAQHSDVVWAALLAFQQARRSLYKTIRYGYHARRLKSLGFEEDVKFCCQLDVSQFAPVLKGDSIVLFT